MPVGKVVKASRNYCKKVITPKGRFDRRSFRTIKRGRTLVTIGCPKGHWHSERPKGKQCDIGTRAQRILKKKTATGTCPRM